MGKFRSMVLIDKHYLYQLENRFAVIDIPWGENELQQFTAITDDQAKFFIIN